MPPGVVAPIKLLLMIFLRPVLISRELSKLPKVQREGRGMLKLIYQCRELMGIIATITLDGGLKLIEYWVRGRDDLVKGV